MAKTGAVWGIDLGQAALKALRCRLGDDGTIVAEAFDFIEYPKMLSQPDANPTELMKEAIETFLSRNSVRGDKVAISVSGQSGLTRFIKLPPVESKKIPDIVKYEAKQQIPFALEDVVWDYQQLAGGSVEEGFALETEVGLFAMKRDQVFRALRPFTDAGIEIDIIQLTPLALYNFVTFDQMPDTPPLDQYDPGDPPVSTVVLSLGADMSDLVVTNGYRVWQRTINLGGNHFTKALTKQMKLTFAKAEHLKRNAMKAEDPKAVFQAMRPVFGELLGEVQRSLSFFQNMDRSAKLGRIVALGNAMKLRGLHKYLAQNLDMEVTEFDAYKQLTGPSVIGSPAFKENSLSFGVCYGLAVQALGKGRLSTNLLPREILKERMIRAKKPWAVAAVATLMLGCTLGYLGKWREWSSAQEDLYTSAFNASKGAQDTASGAASAYDEAKKHYEEIRQRGQRLGGMGEWRLVWAEMLKAVNECLPRDPGKTPDDISLREVLYIDSIDCEYFADPSAWKTAATEKMHDGKSGAPPGGAAPAATPDAAAAPESAPPPAADAPADAAPAADPGAWVIEIKGHHYHNKDQTNQGADYVRKRFIKTLAEKNDLALGDVDDANKPIRISMKELGIDLPVLINPSVKIDNEVVTDPNVDPNVAAAGAGHGFANPTPMPAAAAPVRSATQTLRRFDFVIQFLWKPTPLSTRQDRRAQIKRQQEEKKTEPDQGLAGNAAN
jgi:type IV pilus assembly protein PilM